MNDIDRQNDHSQNSVENWKLLQCKDYLTRYPNGLKAEEVKKQIDKLNATVSNLQNQKKKDPNSSDNARGTSAKTQNRQDAETQTASDSNERTTNIIKVIVTVILVGIGIGLAIMALSSGHLKWLPAIWFGLLAPIFKNMWNW